MGKESTCNAGDPGSTPGSGSSTGEGIGYTYSSLLGLPWWLSWYRICLQCGRPRFDPWVGKIPWRSAWKCTPIFQPGESHGLSLLSLYGGSDGKESTCQCRRLRFDPWVGKIPWRRARQPTPVFLPGESRGQRSLVGRSPWGCRESDTTEQLSPMFRPEVGNGTWLP